MALLTVEGLRTSIAQRQGEVRAVDGVSFSLEAGETLGIVGESGCGKTMTGMSILRLLPPGGYIAGGTISFGGRNLASCSDEEIRDVRGAEIAMVFQDPMTSLNPTMPIGEQIAEAVIRHRDVSARQALERARESLELVGMPRPSERLTDYPHQLSGGLRQRVMIAMALSCEPRLLIADEPTTALDVTTQRQILDLLDSLRERLGMALILITHDLGVIAGRADRVAVMYAGRIVEQATTSRLFSAPRHRYTEALLASIPTTEDDKTRRLPAIEGLPPDLLSPPPGCRFAPRCKHATDTCRAQEPELSLDQSGSCFACFHPAEERPSPAVEVSRTAGVAPAVAATDAEPLLVLDHVVKEFPVASTFRRDGRVVHAVSDVSLSIERGEVFAIVGESGCGKTTLGRIIVALEQPTSGTVTFEGVDLFGLSAKRLRKYRRDLQLMFQDPYSSLDPRMSVESILREPFAIQRIGSRHEQTEKIEALLSEVGLPRHAADRHPHEFSGGQRQRLGLARARALEPKLIVADEPVSALDVSIRSQILNLMLSLQRAHDLSYLLISHDLSVVRYLADRVAVMYLGKVVEIGTVADIFERPAHPYTAGLLEAIPVPDPVVERSKRGAGVKGELPSAIDPPSGCRFRTRCPLAQEKCAAVEPPLISFGGRHQAACHFPLQVPAQPQPAESAECL